MPLLGAHMSIAGGYHKAVEEAHARGCDVVQVFTKNSNQWRARPISDEEAMRFSGALAELNIAHPISHSSYLINLASPNALLRQKSIDALIVELQRADRLGISYVVVHPGAYTTLDQREGMTLVAASINEIHDRAPGIGAQIALEFTAGQGTCLGCSVEQLATIVGQVKIADRVRICVDTCHAFAAGIDLADRKTYLAFWRQFDRLLGLDCLKAIHLNDSKRALGSRVDRHDHIGRGLIGLAAFRHLLSDRRLRHVPMYLETPKGDHDGESWDAINLRTLRELARG